MSQALYRKYRPKTFDEVYGQKNIVNILKNQVENSKISHAYLFSGSRGTGKTSCAKILSRAVNCLNPKEGNPCNECANCKAVLEESSMDVVEMDAASNRRIDDIRQLRDNVIYPPTDLKYKVYIIDEAHMITNEGFNALLKIMEEPPKHLIFILATTEIDKIPDTILSRTQRFEFKKIDNEVIESRLKLILNNEDIEMEDLAVKSISNIGKGSMRDALSILDQVISIDNKKFSADDINDILGIIGEKTKLFILDSIGKKDVQSLIKIVDFEIDKGKDSYNFIKEMIGYLELLLDMKVGILKEDINISDESKELAKNTSLESLVNSLDILIDYEQRIKKSDNRNLLLKMSMIRLVDNTPRDILSSQVKALEERISFLESGARSSHSQSSDKHEYLVDPVSIDQGNPFEQYKEEAKKQDLEREKSEINNALIEESVFEEKDFEDKVVEEKVFEDNSKQEEKLVKDKVEKELDVSINDKDKNEAFERAIRNYVLKKFPPSKQIFNEVKGFELRGNQLIYFLSERGLDFAKVMSKLFRDTEEAFFRQTNKEVVIKFELGPTEIDESERLDETAQRIEKMKNFFDGQIEIIE